jgi:hypothetical protein
MRSVSLSLLIIYLLICSPINIYSAEETFLEDTAVPLRYGVVHYIPPAESKCNSYLSKSSIITGGIFGFVASHALHGLISPIGLVTGMLYGLMYSDRLEGLLSNHSGTVAITINDQGTLESTSCPWWYPKKGDPLGKTILIDPKTKKIRRVSVSTSMQTDYHRGRAHSSNITCSNEGDIEGIFDSVHPHCFSLPKNLQARINGTRVTMCHPPTGESKEFTFDSAPSSIAMKKDGNVISVGTHSGSVYILQQMTRPEMATPERDRLVVEKCKKRNSWRNVGLRTLAVALPLVTAASTIWTVNKIKPSNDLSSSLRGITGLIIPAVSVSAIIALENVIER